MKNRPATAARPLAPPTHARGKKRPQAPVVLQPQPEGSTKAFTARVCIVLGLAILTVYARTFGYDFVAYDDNTYIYENPTVKAGLSLANFVWAFTTFNSANWHPLTWLSYMLDCQLFGVNPGAQHAVNVAWHIAATIVLFLALLRMTRARWRSALVAGIFALHPLHVESVAWIAERKDVMCAFFGMLTLLLYARYVEDRKLTRYLAVAVAFALSLLAKPMAVTLPFVLLLLDFWPLRRVEWSKPREWMRLVWEKLPLFAMVAASSAVTYVAQQRSGAVASFVGLPFTVRLSNALAAYAAYIGKTLWPANLGVLYPIRWLPPAVALEAALLLAAVTVAAVLTLKRYPYFLVGWLWYLGTLVPVIGIVHVGQQSIADRYTYFPMVGLSIAVIWTIAALVENHDSLRTAVATLAVFVVVILAVGCYHQVGFWQDSETLFEHTLAVTKDNNNIENNLAVVLAAKGRNTEAIALYKHALTIAPDDAGAHANLGAELVKLGKYDEAYGHLVEATRLKADSAATEGVFGVVLAARGELDEARKHLERSLELKPGDVETMSNLCFVLQHQGHMEQAIDVCDQALALNPNSSEAWFNLGTAFASQGKKEEAAAEFARALAADPNNASARAALDQLKSPGR